MPTIKRRLANLIERLSGNLVLPPYELHALAERVHLRRLFEFLEVDCVFDVGANAGQYASVLRDAVGFRGQIISFEPIPELAAALREKAAKDPAWHIEEIALDAEVGQATFHVTDRSEFSSLHRPAPSQPAFFTEHNKVVRSVSVNLDTLSAKLPEWRNRLGFARPFLKMDTQGNDLSVVRGGGVQIREFVGLQSELALQSLYEGAPTYSDVISEYRALGFEVSNFVPNNAGHFPVLIEIDCIMLRRDLVPSVLRSL